MCQSFLSQDASLNPNCQVYKFQWLEIFQNSLNWDQEPKTQDRDRGRDHRKNNNRDPGPGRRYHLKK